MAYSDEMNAVSMQDLPRTSAGLLSILPPNSRITRFENPRPVVSSLPFSHERLDVSGLAELFQRIEPNLVGSGDDWDRMLRILGWAHSQYPNQNPRHWPKPESAFEILKNAENGYYDHCDSKGILLVQALLSAGYTARYVEYSDFHAANFPDSNHGFAEVWIDRLQKWAILDPSFNSYYEKEGVPLNCLDIHNLYLASGNQTVPGPDGYMDLGLVRPVENQYQKDKYPHFELEKFRERTFYYFSICMRNDFMSKNLRPEDPGYYINRHRTHWSFLDRRCGRRPLFQNQTADPSDLYWDINWTWMAFKKADTGLKVYFEVNMPSFAFLEVQCNGRQLKISEHQYPSPHMIWELKKGKNLLRATAVNVRGVRGRTVSAEIEL